MGLAGCASNQAATRRAPDACSLFTSTEASSVLGQPVTCSSVVTSSAGTSLGVVYAPTAAALNASQQPLEVLIEVEGAGIVSASQSLPHFENYSGAKPVQVAGQTAYWMGALDWQLAASRHGYLIAVSVPAANDQSQAIAALSVILHRL